MEQWENIPDELRAAILSIWITPRDAARLEAAIVKPETRMAILKSCFDDGFVRVQVNCTNPDAQFRYMNWLVKRSLLVDAISFPTEAAKQNLKVCDEFLYHCGHHLKTVELVGDSSYNNGYFLMQLARWSKSIEILNLSCWNTVKESVLAALFHANKHIRSLNFNGCSNLPNATLFLAATYCPKLEYLSMQGCGDAVTDKGLSWLAVSCTKLQFVDISDNFVLGSGIMSIAEHCADLRCLKIRSRFASVAHWQLMVDGTTAPFDLSVVALRCRKLNILDVSNVPFITGADVTAFASYCSDQLREVHVNGVSGVDDATSTALAESCPQLTHLSIVDCDNVTDAGVLAIAQGCKGLVNIIIGRNEHITQAALSVLGSKAIIIL